MFVVSCSSDSTTTPDPGPTIYGASLLRRNWHYSSVPLGPILGDPFSAVANRGQILWYNSQTVRVDDIHPGEPAGDPNYPVPVLEVIYMAQETSGGGQPWGGLTTSLGPGGFDSLEDVVFLDVWLNDFVPHSRESSRQGFLHVDLGIVSEDAVWDPLHPPSEPNRMLDFEDKDQSGGVIGADEDRGLDGLFSREETVTDRPGSVAQDPAGDDRRGSLGSEEPGDPIAKKIADFHGINGTEENQRPDTEDLNGDRRLQVRNDYF